MSITTDGQEPVTPVGPGDILPNAVGTTEIIDDDVKSIDIGDGEVKPIDLDRAYVEAGGDTMTGLLLLSGVPVVDLGAATKKYVDDSVGAVDLTPYVEKAGSTMSGALDMNYVASIDKVPVYGGLTMNLGAIGFGSGQINFSQFNTNGDAINLRKQGESAPRIAISPDRIGFGDGLENPLLTGLNRVSSGVIGTLAGNQIRIGQDPVVDNDLARKKYVDDSVTAAPFVELAGDTMTGTLLFGAGTDDTAIDANSIRSDKHDAGSVADATGGGFEAYMVSSAAPGLRIREIAGSGEQMQLSAAYLNFRGAGTVDSWTQTIVDDNAMQLSAGDTLRIPQDPVVDNDLARKKYVDDQDALKLSLTGGTMSGGINMGSQPITAASIVYANSRLETPAVRLTGGGTLQAFQTAGDAPMVQGSFSADAFYRFNMHRSGKMEWHDGTADTSNGIILSRVDATHLSLDAGAQLSVLQDPIADNDLSRKKYVDDTAGAYLPLAGGALTGALSIITNVNPTIDVSTNSVNTSIVKGVKDNAPFNEVRLNTDSLQLGENAAIDWVLRRTAANIATLTTGDAIYTDTNPASSDALSRRGYVDTQVGLKVGKGGDTMTGALLMGVGASIISTAASANDALIEGKISPNINESFRINHDGDLIWDTNADGNPDVSASAGGGVLTFGTGKVAQSAAPTSNADLVNKLYVDPLVTTYEAFDEDAVGATTSLATLIELARVTVPAAAPTGTYEVSANYGYTNTNANGIGRYTIIQDPDGVATAIRTFLSGSDSVSFDNPGFARAQFTHTTGTDTDMSFEFAHNSGPGSTTCTGVNIKVEKVL